MKSDFNKFSFVLLLFTTRNFSKLYQLKIEKIVVLSNHPSLYVLCFRMKVLLIVLLAGLAVASSAETSAETAADSYTSSFLCRPVKVVDDFDMVKVKYKRYSICLRRLTNSFIQVLNRWNIVREFSNEQFMWPRNNPDSGSWND